MRECTEHEITIEKLLNTEYDDEEKERLLKYYKDVPVWNITVWHDVITRMSERGILPKKQT